MKENQKKKYLKPSKVLVIFSIFIIIAFSLVFILTGCSFYPLTETGQIGDTIGGITAPILTIGSSVLIYFSFIAQIEANEKLREELDRSQMLRQYDQIYELISALVDDYNKLEYGHSKKGDLAIDQFLKENPMHVINNSDYSSFLRSFAYILESADFSCRKIFYFDDQNRSYKRVLRSRFDNFFATKLSHHINAVKDNPKFSHYFIISEDELKVEIRQKRLIYSRIALNITNILETLDERQYKR